jgi:hypothetical protein
MSTQGPIVELLPPALRDAPPDLPGEPRLLDALLTAVDEQRELLEADIDQVWEDLFVESCAEWAVPYIGALLGLPPDAERLEVAYAIALRRRKGTPAALEDFAEVLTGLTAHVVEGWQVTAWAQRLGHPPPPRVSSLDLRDRSRFRIGTPFERAARTFAPSGRFSPSVATAIVWPWTVRTFHAVEAAPLPEARRFALHPLALEAPPYLRPQPGGISGDELRARTGDELDAPVRATYRLVQALATDDQIAFGTNWAISDEHPLAAVPEPGEAVLLELTLDDAPIPWTRLRFGSLPPGGPAPAPPTATRAIVDLSRGHVELGSSLSGALRATWHRPVPGGLGALAGDADANPAARVVVRVNRTLPVGGEVVHDLASAFAKGEELSAGLDPDDSSPDRPDVEIRLETSDRLAAPPPASFAPTLPRWRVVATRPSTPTIVGDLALDLDGCCLGLEGFLLTGDLVLGKRLGGVDLRHVTMNPPAGASLRIEDGAWVLALSASRCILGPIRADLGARPLTLADCVVDGRGARLRVCGDDPGGTAVPAVARRNRFDPLLEATGVTFAGRVHVEAINAADCIFADGLEVVQQQEGCLRNCFVTPAGGGASSGLPKRYRCLDSPPPTFALVGFEAAGYYSLDLDSDQPLLRAASDGGEVGAYHHLRRAARLQRLATRLHEFVPLGIRPRLELAPWEE